MKKFVPNLKYSDTLRLRENPRAIIPQQGTIFDNLIGTTQDGQPLYSTQTACLITGVTARQLDYWVRCDLFRNLRDQPTFLYHQHRRLFTLRDLKIMKIVKSLIDAGVSLQTIKKCFIFEKI